MTGEREARSSLRAGTLPAGPTPQRGNDDVRIVDIALRSEARGARTGGALVREVMDDAPRSGKSASIHVERANRALGLYQRLGFERVDDHGVYYVSLVTVTHPSFHGLLANTASSGHRAGEAW